MSSSNLENGESPNPALRLPPEIVKIIIDQVPNSTIKNLRLTCRFYWKAAALRLDRVFISANPRNVEVFTAIANHDVFRTQITEIIWDDALLYARPVSDGMFVEGTDRYTSDDDYEDSGEEDGEGDEDGIDWRQDVPGWFRIACRRNVEELKWRTKDDVERPSLVAREQQITEQMPMEKAWAYYNELLQQQRGVLDSKTHIDALEKHIGSFPALRRITVTGATHGLLYSPLYETPMIRAFPRGFNHYVPPGWPVSGPGNPRHHIDPICDEWDEDGSDWQGFRVVTRLLAENKDFGRVTELCIDANEKETGLNSHLFGEENRSSKVFEAVLARPNLTHLQLDLMVDQHYGQADAFRSGLLKHALAGASAGQGLEYLSLRTNTQDPGSDYPDMLYVPITTILTPPIYSRLRHLGLVRFFVKEDDLLALLGSLPMTLHSVELSMLEFMDKVGSYRTLLCGIRDNLGWKERDPRPNLTIRTDVDPHHPKPGRSISLENDLDRFLYQGGDNPFGDGPAQEAPNTILLGFGWERDSFDPEHQRPYVEDYVLADMGIIKRSTLWPAERPAHWLPARQHMDLKMRDLKCWRDEVRDGACSQNVPK